MQFNLFLVYWQAKVDIAIKVGKSRDEVMEILAAGEKVCYYGDFASLRAGTEERYLKNPDLIAGKVEPDPEMTIADDEELELSVVFTPPTDLSFRKSPSIPEEPDLEPEASDFVLDAEDLNPEISEEPKEKSEIAEEKKENSEAPPKTPLKDVTLWQNLSISSPATAGHNATFFKLIVSV